MQLLEKLVMKFADMWMGLESIMLSKNESEGEGQTQNDHTHCGIERNSIGE